jgi:hypothetical protein
LVTGDYHHIGTADGIAISAGFKAGDLFWGEISLS